MATEPERKALQRRKRRKRRSAWLPFVVACVAVILLGLVALAASLWRSADTYLADVQQADPRQRTVIESLPTITAQPGPDAGSLSPRPSATPIPEAAIEVLPASLQQPFSVLLIGVDKRAEEIEGVRSDTLIVVRVNPQERWASMLSIPRDSVVQVPNLGWSKINAAYSFGYQNADQIYGAGTAPDAGGGALAAETVEGFLNIKVDYTAQIDFRGFETLIDTVGGLLIDVPVPLLDGEYPTENYGYQRIFIPAGLQVLDGRTALIYARTRHASSDYDRGRRQQQVLRGLLEQMRARGMLANAAMLPEWAEVLRQNVRTTLPIRDFAVLNGLALLARDLKSDRILQVSINPNDVALDHEDGSDLYWNAADVASVVERWKNGPEAP